MKNTLLAILVVVLTIALMMLTSLLFDWDWIQENWVRKAIIIALIIIEFFHGYLVYIQLSKKIAKEQG
jgi:ABC-type sugar transport system permease subunit